jgi:hypothetical protein
MIVLPKQGVIVVATPRTGSRALNEGITSAAKAAGDSVTQTKEHHTWPHVVLNLAESKGYEIWSLVREPYDHIQSWMGHMHCTSYPEITTWLNEYSGRYFMYEGGMNIYRNVVTRYFIYDQNGHQKMLSALGYEGEFPHIGGSHRVDYTFSEEQKKIIRDRFFNDFELYELECNKENTRSHLISS